MLHSAEVGQSRSEITLTIIIYLRCKDSSFITCGDLTEVKCRHIDQMESRQNSYETSYQNDDGMKADDRMN